MSKFKDLTGQRFGRLTVLYRLHNCHKKRVHWLCHCDCGKLVEVQSGHLLSSHTKSCGCLSTDKSIQRSTTHGKSNSKLYKLYYNIKARCYNKNSVSYKYYGARGIKICSEWLNDFMSFYNWAMNTNYQEGLTIDRIDTDGNYEPNNCRWATPEQQAKNRRSNRIYTINGETHCVVEWCEILGLNYWTVIRRIDRGWSIEQALELENKK